MPEEEKKAPRVPKTDDEVRQLAMDVVDNKVFLATMCPDSMLKSIFLPLALGALTQMTEEELNNIGNFYEYISKAEPRSINGYPMFLSVRILTKEEVARMDKFIQQYMSVKNQFLDKTQPEPSI